MMTVHSITIRVMEKHGINGPKPLPPALARALEAEARYEADKLRAEQNAERDRLTAARGILLALAITLITTGILWGFWRVL